MFEHLAEPNRLLQNLARLLNLGGVFYLSWTNWLSPWGGHEFSPWHYFGRTSDSFHTVGKNLFKLYIGEVLRSARAREEGFIVEQLAPRYYNEFAFLVKLPGVREFLP